MNETEQPAVAGPVEPKVMQHTLGPWRFNKQMGQPWTISDARGHSLMGNEQYYPWVPGDEADWRLIAAAPDMLAALQVILTRWDGCDDDDTPPAVAEARNVVARAVGAA